MLAKQLRKKLQASFLDILIKIGGIEFFQRFLIYVREPVALQQILVPASLLFYHSRNHLERSLIRAALHILQTKRNDRIPPHMPLAQLRFFRNIQSFKQGRIRPDFKK